MDPKTKKEILTNILLGKEETVQRLYKVIEDIMETPVPGKSIPRQAELNVDHNILYCGQRRMNTCLVGDQKAMYIGIHGKYKMMCKRLKTDPLLKFKFNSSFFRQSFHSSQDVKAILKGVLTLGTTFTNGLFVFPPLLLQSSETCVLYSSHFIFLALASGPIIPMCFKKVTPSIIKRLYNLRHHTTVTVPTLNYLLRTKRVYSQFRPASNLRIPSKVYFI
jgi:hypothetical protein